ncbi:MAG: 1-acyl-sn-glycerol-3-phosphate acyltransferase [Flavobacteriales bacterium]|jgi:1-acyl-sn-glycerol-3-phosphate acyltransferase|nr:1-acyl-sn-glycerol-3-phosphate acyltransferase [Flavobacteriales bacterium]
MIGRFKNWTGTYIYGYLFVKIGINTFYRKHEAHKIETVPYGEKPILFATNHQNAFLDPILTTVSGKHNTYYLTRADIFQKPFLNWLFRSIYMLPIYRQRDGGNTVERNQPTFNECYDLLKKNNIIIIYPEGNHNGQKSLRPLKKGLVRIGYGADDKYNNELDIHIIPVGLNYSVYDGFQSEFLINFGEPIRLNDYNDLRAENENKAIDTIMAEVRKGMSKEMLDVRKMDYYEAIHEMLFLFPEQINHAANESGDTLYSKFKAQKQFIAKIEDTIEKDSSVAEQLNQKAKSVIDYTKEKGLKYWLFNQEKYSFGGIFLAVLGLIIGLPFHIYGMLNNYIPYKIPVWFVNSKIKDKTFHGSFKMAFGVLFFKLFWTFQTVIVAWLTDDYIWVLYLATLPISAIFSWNYWKIFLKTRGKIRYNALSKTPEFKTVKENRAYLLDLI